MPYYCTVPRCTSMAGKAKNVSFHQFPRDEELAELWNNILKRGKPYTKYSKVCSLHFRPEDYTITSAGKNKGQWRTLRKDAIPSQNLPSDSPAPYRRRQSEGWIPNNVQLEPQLQMAQALYVQTMIAMQAAGFTDAINTSLCNGAQPQNDNDPDRSSPQTSSEQPSHNDIYNGNFTNTSYKCTECTKCFKDPDVFILHKRTHKDSTQKEKENFNLNALKPEMLKSNPILANLLKNSMEKNVFENDTFQKQFMLSISNAENYLRSEPYSDPECDDLSDNLESNSLVIDENVA